MSFRGFHIFFFFSYKRFSYIPFASWIRLYIIFCPHSFQTLSLSFSLIQSEKPCLGNQPVQFKETKYVFWVLKFSFKIFFFPLFVCSETLRKSMEKPSFKICELGFFNKEIIFPLCG